MRGKEGRQPPFEPIINKQNAALNSGFSNSLSVYVMLDYAAALGFQPDLNIHILSRLKKDISKTKFRKFTFLILNKLSTLKE